MKLFKHTLLLALFIFSSLCSKAQTSNTLTDLENQKAKAVAEENYVLAGELSKQIKELKEKEVLEKQKAIAAQQRKAGKAKQLAELEKQKKEAVAVQDYSKAGEIKKKIDKLTLVDDLEKQKAEAVAKADYGLAADLKKKIEQAKADEENEDLLRVAEEQKAKQIAALEVEKKAAADSGDYPKAAELKNKIEAIRNSNGSATNSVAKSTQKNPQSQITTSKYDTGELMSETEMVNGVLNGTSKMYHKNGKLMSETSYKDGKPHGMMKSYDEKGTLIMESPFVDGQITGVMRVYDPSTGRLTMETEHVNGKMNGLSKLYDPSGKALTEANYVNGVQVGKMKMGKEVPQGRLSSGGGGMVGTKSSQSVSQSAGTSPGKSMSAQTFSANPAGSVVYTKTEKSKIRHSEDNSVSGIKYRRSSLYTMMIHDAGRTYCDVIAQSFVDAPLPIKFNDHDLNEKVIPAGAGGDQTGNIDNYVNANAIAKAIVAKWFNRTEKGTFNMDLIAERGNYNASVADLKLAALSARGNALLSDAGEDLIGNTFVVVNDFLYTNKEEVANKAKAGMSLLSGLSSIAGGPDLSAAETITNASLTVAGKGYIIRNTSYLYRLVWNEEVAATFYQDYWMDDSNFDPAKKAAFENSNLFTLRYVGQETATADLQSNVFTSKTEEELIARATSKAVDAGIAKLQRKFDEFKTKTPLETVDPLTAKIGLKEGLEAGDKFEVLEAVQDPLGRTTYQRKGVITVDRNIWDNRYDVGEVPEGGTVGNQFTVFRGAGTFYPGMLIKQLR